MSFASHLNKTPKVQTELRKWDIGISEQLVRIRARCLEPEKIISANKAVTRYQVTNAEWQNVLRYVSK
jgi:hypothetical protein